MVLFKFSIRREIICTIVMFSVVSKKIGPGLRALHHRGNTFLLATTKKTSALYINKKKVKNFSLNPISSLSQSE